MRTDGITYFSPYIDEFGNSVKKTKQTHPYSYDGFVTYRAGMNQEVNSTIYSDRLLQWDYEKTRKLMQKHFGNTGDYYNDRSLYDIEAFLSEWTGDKVKIIFIMEYCNQSNGYPLWRFDIKTEK